MGNPLHWGWLDYWIVVGGLLLLTLIAGFVVAWIAKPLKVRIIRLELAESIDEANRILAKWSAGNHLRRARSAIIADYVFTLFYPPLSALLVLGLVRYEMVRSRTMPGPAQLGVGVAIGLLTCLVWDGLENTAMLRTLKLGATTARVDATRWFARFKFGGLAIGVSYVFFWIFYRMEVGIAILASDSPRTVGWVIFAGFAVMGSVMFMTARTLKPSLMMLQLAPSRSAVNRVLAKWDGGMRETAQRAIGLDVLFVMLYTGVAALFFGTAGRSSGPTLWILAAIEATLRIPAATQATMHLATEAILRTLANTAGWLMVAAGALQWAQDWGVYYTLRVGQAGWWSQATRIAGSMRITLIQLAAGIGLIFVIRWELGG
jgi:hypothetical protein